MMLRGKRVPWNSSFTGEEVIRMQRRRGKRQEGRPQRLTLYGAFPAVHTPIRWSFNEDLGSVVLLLNVQRLNDRSVRKLYMHGRAGRIARPARPGSGGD